MTIVRGITRPLARPAARLQGVSGLRRRSLFRKARWTLVLWNVAVLTVILAATGAFIYELYASHLYTEVDHRLEEQRSAETQQIVGGGQISSALYNPAPDTRTAIITGTLQVYATTDCPPYFYQCPPAARQATSLDGAETALRTGKQDIRTATFQGEPQRVLSFPILNMTTGQPLWVVQISRNVASLQASLDRLGVALLAAIGLGIGASALGSLFLANRALVPIRDAFSRQRQFTADASHELRTPLALIRANAEMLDRPRAGLKPEDAELVHDIIQETDRLNRLVGDLLTLARADSETVQLTPRPLDLTALVADVHEDLAHIAEGKGIASGVALDGPVIVQGDAGRLRQLLLILLDNALKYTDPGGRVDIGLQRDGSHAHLRVSDTGIGIPEADIPRVFDRFYRVDRARERDTGGTGLGLSIARWIVQAHRGSIRVESPAGRGTTFIVDLPVAGG